jgi:hypothetical protein
MGEGKGGGDLGDYFTPSGGKEDYLFSSFVGDVSIVTN